MPVAFAGGLATPPVERDDQGGPRDQLRDEGRNGGLVGDAFDEPCDEDVIDGAGDALRVVRHVHDELAEDRPVEGVDLVVPTNDLARQVCVTGHVSGDGIVDHGLGEPEALEAARGQIKTLEDYLQTELFERTGRSIKLTKAGQTLVVLDTQRMQQVFRNLFENSLALTDDPVRMYLREMGKVPLLDRQGEVEIAMRIEDGQLMIAKAVFSLDTPIHELKILTDKVDNGELRLDEVVQVETGGLHPHYTGKKERQNRFRPVASDPVRASSASSSSSQPYLWTSLR